MNLWRSFSGMVEAELTSAELPEALLAINALGIELLDLRWKDELTCQFRTDRNRYGRLLKLAQKRGETLTVRKHIGMYWRAKAMLHRPVLTVGFILLLMLSVTIPNRIFFVRVEGNNRIPQQRILEAAEMQGVRFGASRRELRNETIKNGLLSEIPQLQWVGVNTAGCVATISVRERSAVREASRDLQVSRIVASQDGYILSGTVVRGTGMFQPGQAVLRGQTLISGYMDGGFCIRAVRAEGEIVAQTNRKIRAVTPACSVLRGSRKGTKRKISLLIRKKRINLWKDSGISDSTCGRMYKEYYITLPGGYRLPAALCVDVYTQWDTVPAESDPQTAQRQLQEFSRRYLQQQMIAGSLGSCDEIFTSANDRYVLEGHYICEEMIGREQPEQIGEGNGKNN